MDPDAPKPTAFTWKRKTSQNVSKSVSSEFQSNFFGKNDNKVKYSESESKRPTKSPRLEDSSTESARIQSEGVTLAENERYWEAIRKFDSAIALTPDSAKLFEMKAQALLAVLELHPASICAEKAIDLEPTWWVAYQTLGRVHLGLGEVGLAVKDFTKAIHLNPSEKELWHDDLEWALSLVRQKQTNQHKCNDENSDESDCSETDSCVIEEINTEEEIELQNGNHSMNVHRKESNGGLDEVPTDYIQMRDNL